MLWFNVSPAIFRLIHCIYTAVSFYLLAGLLRCFYLEHCSIRISGCKCRKTDAIFDSESSRAQAKSIRQRGLSSYKRSRLIRAASNLMIGLSLLAGTLTFFHVLLDLWTFSTQSAFSLGILCHRQKWSGVMFFATALCLYTFLWIRQRVFYSHPVLRNLASPVLNRFSWSVLFTIIFSITIFIIVYYAVPADKMPNSEKNATTLNTNSTLPRYPCTFKSKVLYLSSHFIITGTFLYFQISLQFLFAYPVMKNKFRRKQVNTRSIFNEDKQRNGKIKNLKSAFYPDRAESATNSCDPGFYEESETSSNSFKKILSASNRSLSNYLSTVSPTLRQAHSESSIKSATSSNILYKKCLNFAHNQKRNGKLYNDKSGFEKTRTLCNSTSNSESKLTALKYQLDQDKKASMTLQNLSLIRKQKKSSHRRLKRYVWRCFFVSLVCCVSDVIAFAINAHTQISSHKKYTENFSESPNNTFGTFYQSDFAANGTNSKKENVYEERVTISLLSVAAFNGSMVINLLGMVLCYDKWTSMLFPCFMGRCSHRSSKGSVEEHKC